MPLPRFDASRALGAYAALTTVGLAWLAVTAAAPSATRFDTIDVNRINLREPDGTLRMAIASEARFPGLIVKGREYPHPRGVAGMIFYNDEGSENGGLVFDGGLKDGVPTNGGSLTFDRYLQDQTVQMSSDEDGPRRRAGFTVLDRPDRPMQLDQGARITAMPDGPAKTAAARAASFDGRRRAFLGRSDDGTSRLDLSDAAGRSRLRLEVGPDGSARIVFLDAAGHVTRTVSGG